MQLGFFTKGFLGIGCLAAPIMFFYLPLASDFSSTSIAMVEDCANALDDDGDGLIDLNDPDCSCSLIQPVSRIPNPSFEDLDCCPSNRSQLNCANTWIQASEPTTDLIHDCGWQGWESFPAPRPFPDGESVMGFRDGRAPSFPDDNQPRPNWKEYAGACLLEPLKAGQTYRFEFDVGFVDQQQSPPIRITIFGTEDCQFLPFGIGNAALGCPTNGDNWQELGGKNVNGGFGGGWVNSFIEVTPRVDIAAIAIGPSCRQSSSSVSTYYFFDNLLLDNLTNFTFQISPTNHPCAEGLTFQVPELSGIDYQWYLDGIALLGETSFRLSQTYGEGDYQVVIEDGMNCQSTSTYRHSVPVIFSTPSVTLCADEVYPFGDLQLDRSGVYRDTFRSIAGCDSIALLDLTVLEEVRESVSAKIFPGEVYAIGRSRIRRPGEYPITLTSSLGCDSLVLLDLSFYQVYFPTAFSPNDDGVNDRFSVQGGEDLLEVTRLEVFDRWGNLLSVTPEWAGRREGEPLDPGIYVFVAYLQMSDGLERRIAGEVLLLK